MRSRLSRKDFLEALFGEYVSKRDGFIRVMTSRPLDRRVSNRYFPKIETLSKEQYPDNQHVFFGVCPHESMKADKTSIRYMVALWAGLDLQPDGFSGKTEYFKEMSYAAKAVRSFPLPPSMVVESGWGVHLYWLLKNVTEITDPSRVEKLLTALSEYFQCRRPIGIDSTLRLPDTFNCKHHSSLVRCTVKYLNAEFRYDLEEFEQLTLIGVATGSGGAEDQDAAGGLHVETSDDFGLSDEPDASTASPNWENGGQPRIRGPLEVQPEAEIIKAAAASVAPRQHPANHPAPERGYGSKSPGIIDEEIEGETVVVMAESALDADEIADEIVEKVVHKLANELMEKLADNIVEKLYKRITAASIRK